MMIPPKLKPGDEVRLVAPSCAVPQWFEGECMNRAKDWFQKIGCSVSEAGHIHERNEFDSTSIEHRVYDLMKAFRDPAVKMIIAVRGGWNANQLLPHLDYGTIQKNPKILCGFSDITVLSNAIYAETGLATYSGPNFTHFSFGDQLKYTHDAFRRCLMEDGPFKVEPSKQWCDDRFTPDHQALEFEPNKGWWTLQQGEAEGTIIGGNLCTLNLLQGTRYMPELRDSVLFLEDDLESSAGTFDRNLQSLLDQTDSNGIRGLVIGRFQKTCTNRMPPMDKSLLEKVISTKPTLRKLPVIANVDFGHTHPMITFPIGGTVRIVAGKKLSTIKIVNH